MNTQSDEFDLTDIVISIQEIELLNIVKSQSVDSVWNVISREYTGIDSETDTVISCVLQDISNYNPRSKRLLNTTNMLPVHYKKLVYLILENIINLLTGHESEFNTVSFYDYKD